MDQGSTGKRSALHNFAPTVTKFCVMWEGRALPHDTKFGNCRCEMVGRRVIFIWSLIHGSSWSGLIKSEPGHLHRLSDKREIWLFPLISYHFTPLIIWMTPFQQVLMEGYTMPRAFIVNMMFPFGVVVPYSIHVWYIWPCKQFST